MKAKLAIPLLAIVAIIAGVAGLMTGLAFLIVFAVVGFIAAVTGAIWTGRKLN